MGIKESPIGSNTGDSIDIWQDNFRLHAQPWCAMGLSCNLVNSKVYGYPYSARALDFKVSGHKGIWQITRKQYDIEPGDILIFDYGLGRGHVSIVSQVLDNGYYETIGYNESDRVLKRVRSFNEMVNRGLAYILPVNCNII